MDESGSIWFSALIVEILIFFWIKSHLRIKSIVGLEKEVFFWSWTKFYYKDQFINNPLIIMLFNNKLPFLMVNVLASIFFKCVFILVWLLIQNHHKVFHRFIVTCGCQWQMNIYLLLLVCIINAYFLYVANTH